MAAISWGQSVLLARRLIEAGVRLVHVNWAREPGDSAVDNPMWDTHAQNADRLQDALCPQFDVTFAALMDDLAQRGLLDETLVVVIGEFGRTPRINSLGGRDHWGRVFSFALAGAGIRGGQVFGASDQTGGFPVDNPIRPHDLTATIFHLLGINPQGVFHDRSNRPHLLTHGRAVGPPARHSAGDDGALPSPAATRPLFLLTTISAWSILISRRPAAAAATPLTRDKGWRAAPICEPAVGPFLHVRHFPGGPFVLLGFVGSDGTAIAQGSRALLAQEIRIARGGHYTFTVRSSGGGTSAEYFRDVFLTHFTCRLVLFRFADANKDPRKVQELASASFQPVFDDAPHGPHVCRRSVPRLHAGERQLSDWQRPGSRHRRGEDLGGRPATVRARAAIRLRSHPRRLSRFQPAPGDDSVID